MSKKEKREKTNVMRILDQHGIAYESHFYTDTDAIAGTEVAAVLHQDPAHVLKTLVTRGASGGYYVFMIPVAQTLSLKKSAKAVGEKSIEMIKSKELLPLTGYIHGGCSPIGMKKEFPTVVDATAKNFSTILFSAGRIGYQVEMAASALETFLPITYADLVE